MDCSICGKPIPAVGNWTEGNNAEPVNSGRCCNECNMSVVVPARMGYVNSRPATDEYEWTIRTEAGMRHLKAPDADAAAAAWGAREGVAAVQDMQSLIAYVEASEGSWMWIESDDAPDGGRVYAGEENMPR